MPKKIPYAIGSYEEIIEGNYYFVDKTAYIRLLEQYKAPVFLRPRRFGKSLWCSILECYYDIKRKEKFESLFGASDIGRHPTQLRNSRLVLRLNFSKISTQSGLPLLEQSFHTICRSAIEVFLSYYSEFFKGFTFHPEISTADQLAELLDHIIKTSSPPLYILIDEYDNFTNQLIITHQNNLYYNLTTGDSFFRTFFKVIKAGIEEQSVDRIFITGVLPITMDDLTSEFNVAEIITLSKPTLHMLGFSQKEAESYIANVIRDYGFDKSLIPLLNSLAETYYNGYRFRANDETLLYNSTIFTFFLKNLIMENGELPWEFIDDNLRIDIRWIERLTSIPELSRELVEILLIKGELPYDAEQLRSKFNMNQFFDKDFFPVSLFYLGMFTIQDEFTMRLPNQTMKKIFTEYFNIIEDVDVSKGYTEMFRNFVTKPDIEKLFSGYFEIYIGRLPARVFDKVNENFYRTTFYELCTRYLSHHFTLSIEVNHPSGRTDMEILGKYHTKYKNQIFLIEFKFYRNTEAKKIKLLNMKNPLKEDENQVRRYKKDILHKFPEFHVHVYLKVSEFL